MGSGINTWTKTNWFQVIQIVAIILALGVTWGTLNSKVQTLQENNQVHYTEFHAHKDSNTTEFRRVEERQDKNDLSTREMSVKIDTLILMVDEVRSEIKIHTREK